MKPNHHGIQRATTVGERRYLIELMIRKCQSIHIVQERRVIQKCRQGFRTRSIHTVSNQKGMSAEQSFNGKNSRKSHTHKASHHQAIRRVECMIKHPRKPGYGGIIESTGKGKRIIYKSIKMCQSVFWPRTLDLQEE